MSEKAIGFIGAGFMAEAVLRGILDADVCSAQTIMASDVTAERRDRFAALGVEATDDNRRVISACATVLIAVKPQNLSDILPEIGASLTADHLLLTICAGCPTAMFERAAGGAVRVVRAMPNLPMCVGRGVSAVCKGRHATDDDLDLARRIFGAAGSVVVVDEPLIDAVTAVSGSGPAYVYFLAEVMIDAGIREGLSPEVARELAVQTIRGAGDMMAADDASPEELRARVTSKGGTTEAAFRSIEQSGVREDFVRAIQAAAARARELGQGK